MVYPDETEGRIMRSPCLNNVPLLFAWLRHMHWLDRKWGRRKKNWSPRRKAYYLQRKHKKEWIIFRTKWRLLKGD